MFHGLSLAIYRLARPVKRFNSLIIDKGIHAHVDYIACRIFVHIVYPWRSTMNWRVTIYMIYTIQEPL